jgi:hypothetical protein
MTGNSMRIAAPLFYAVAGITRRGKRLRSVSFVDVIAWDIDEFRLSDTEHAITTANWHRGHDFDEYEFRIMNGTFVRPTAFPGGYRPLQRKELVRVDGDRFAYGSLAILCEQIGYNPGNLELYQKALRLFQGPSDIVGRIPDYSSVMETIVSSGRETELLRLQRCLGSMMIMGDTLWRRTHEPLVKLSIFPDRLEAALHFEDGSMPFVPTDDRPAQSIILPLAAFKRDHFSAALGKRFDSDVSILEPSSYVGPSVDVSLWAARRAASLLSLMGRSSAGDMPSDVLHNWLALRGEATDTAVSASEMVEVLTPVQDWLAQQGHDVSEASLTLELLAPDLVDRYLVTERTVRTLQTPR